MKLDMYASEVQFADHLAAVWGALPASVRGEFIVPHSLAERSGPRSWVPIASTPQVQDLARPVLVASYGDVRRMRRMGRTRIAFIEHGIGQSYGGDPKSADREGYAGGRDRADVDLNLVPNEHAAARWRAAYPQTTTEIVGCPKLATLPAREPGPGPVVALSFHFPLRIVPEMETALSHYAAVLPELARHFAVIGHAHPKGDWPNRMARRYRRAGIEFVADFADVCRRADVYVCDNSSTLFEFAATGRPVVVLNAPWYRRDVEHGLRFWSASCVGLNVERPQDLIAGVERALADGPDLRAARASALAEVYAYRADAAERAAGALMAWTSERIEAAA